MTEYWVKRSNTIKKGFLGRADEISRFNIPTWELKEVISLDSVFFRNKLKCFLLWAEEIDAKNWTNRRRHNRLGDLGGWNNKIWEIES